MFKAKTNRTGELRDALASATTDLAAARSSLGTAVADGDDEAAAAVREEVARLERLTSELQAAVPVAEQRDREAADREAAERQRAEERTANADRKRRIAAAAKVDMALAALGRAYDEYVALPTGGTPENSIVLARRAKVALGLAMAHHSLPVARALGVQAVPGAQHRRPLAESEATVIREFDV